MKKIGIFAYNFPHWKTQQTLINLILSGRKPVAIFAADRVKLSHYQSKVRITPRDRFLWHPREIAKHFEIPYHVVIHNSEETSALVKEHSLDIGIISGSRILKPISFENFKIGVINLHPGILPENRGLDTIKWAIIKDFPQGATAHLIDKNIDRGQLIVKSQIQIYGDDTLIDLQMRVQDLEQELLLKSLEILEKQGIENFSELGVGNYNSAVPEDEESSLMEKFSVYLKNHSS